MKLKTKQTIFRILSNHRLWLGVWTAVAVLGVVTRISKGGAFNFNNFRIFRSVFRHTVHRLPLYAEYPAEHFDVNHYGVLFSAVIAPFAVLPVLPGVLLWMLANVWILFYAVRQLNIAPVCRGFIYFFALNELFMAVSMQQFNIGLTALLVLAYAMTEKGKDKWATLFIVIGTLTKIYGIAGLAFFFFSRHKKAFIGWGLLWIAILFALPMLYTSPHYVLEQYAEWFRNLLEKNGQNLFADLQNMGFVGFVRKTTQNTLYSDAWIFLPALLIFAIPYLRFSQYKYRSFGMMFLASALLFIVLFSTGTEHSGYIIAYIGIALWFVLSPHKNAPVNIAVLAVGFIGTFLVSDVVPPAIRREYVYPYALKAVPVTLVWLKIIYDLCFGNFQRSRIEPSTEQTSV